MAKRLKARKNPKISTFEEIKNELENYGIGIIKTNNYGDGPVDDKDFRHYQVYEIGNKFRGESYYSISDTDRDLKLAFEAGLKLAKKLGHKRIPYAEKRQNPKPKCKIIQVRRKIRIAGKSRVVHARKRICNPELDLARMKRLLASELSQYDEKLQKKQPNMYRLGHYFGAVDKAFARLDNESTLEDMKESICRSFDPQLPPVKKFLKKYT
jgi:hypothetical protein